jgi:outer membrane immunogenic protein
MNKLFFLGAKGLALVIAQPAFAADFPLGPPAKASFVSRFTWTGCYLGAHGGGAWERKDATDPVQLVQDSLSGGPVTVGATVVNVHSNGAVVGGQIGCDYQFSPNFVVGVEGAVSAGTMKGSTLVALPAGNPGDAILVTARTDFIPAVTARLGYAMDHWLFYVKGGGAWTNDKYSATGTFAGIAFDAEGLGMRSGWTAGGGVEWAFTDDWSARLEYDYYDFGRQTVTMTDTVNAFTGPIGFRQSAQMVKLGVNFRVGQ